MIILRLLFIFFFFFFNDTPPTEIYPLPLHDALPISLVAPDLARTARGTALVAELQRHAVPVEEVGARTFLQLADTDTPQGILGVIEPRRWSEDDLALRGGGVALVIDAVQDPANVGTLLRTPHALGARSEEHTSELQSPCNLVCRLLLEKKK